MSVLFARPSSSTRPRIVRGIVLTPSLALPIIAAHSSVLPIPYALYQTGMVAGFFAILTVASVTDYTSTILLDCAHTTGTTSYEQMAEKSFGVKFRIFTQWCLLLLLFGNLCGSLTALGEVAGVAVYNLGLAPAWEEALTDNHSRLLLIGLTAVVVFPLCMLRKMRQLEIFGAGGFFVVILLIVVTVAGALEKDFPAIRRREFQLLSMQEDAAEAFGILGFAFYIQPIVLPLLSEMPKGKAGVRVAKNALHVTIFAFAAVIYLLIGFFGAAQFGDHTKGDILENFKGKLVPIMDILVTLYLAVSYPTIQFSLRCSLDKLVAGNDPEFSWGRHTAETVAAVGGSLAVAVFFPKGSSAMFAITGSSAVCIVCYIMPVVFHFRFKKFKSKYAGSGMEALGVGVGNDDRQPLLSEEGAVGTDTQT